MGKKKLIFKKVFATNPDDAERLLYDDELPIASFVYDIAYDEIHGGQENSDSELDNEDDDTDSVISFDEKIEAVKKNFVRIVEAFKATDKAKDSFLKSYDHWAKLCKESIESLRVFAEEMQTNKFNSDVARVVGGLVAALGGILVGISFLSPLAPVTIPLAIGGGVASALGSGVVAGTSGTEIVLVKNRLEKAKKLVLEEQSRFSDMSHWFTLPEELENTISALLDYDIFKGMVQEVQKFLEEVTEQTNLTLGEFKKRLKEVLKHCMVQMMQDGKIVDEFGTEIAPVVMTFVFVVCLMRDHNRIVLDCVMITQRLALGLMSGLDLGVQAGHLISGLLLKGAVSISRIAVMEIFVGIGVVIDVLNVVLSSIDIHKKPETVHTKKIKEVAQKFEKVFLFIESVYNETKQFKSQNDMETVVIIHVPDDAVHADLEMAVKHHLPQDAWDCIKVRRLARKGNNWVVKVPASCLEMLMQQSTVTIKGKSCEVTH